MVILAREQCLARATLALCSLSHLPKIQVDTAAFSLVSNRPREVKGFEREQHIHGHIGIETRPCNTVAQDLLGKTGSSAEDTGQGVVPSRM